MMLWCLFGGKSRYAVPARCVREIVPRVHLHPLTGTAEGMCGSMHYRGGWVPVVDAGMLLEGVASGCTMATRILVLTVPMPEVDAGADPEDADGVAAGEVLVGVLADGVTEVVALPETEADTAHDAETDALVGGDAGHAAARASAVRPYRIHTQADGTPIQCLRVSDLIPADISP